MERRNDAFDEFVIDPVPRVLREPLTDALSGRKHEDLLDMLINGVKCIFIIMQAGQGNMSDRGKNFKAYNNFYVKSLTSTIAAQLILMFLFYRLNYYHAIC
ncbi:uncharacterized protein DAT39_011769, partial [Clarias magur]